MSLTPWKIIILIIVCLITTSDETEAILKTHIGKRQLGNTAKKCFDIYTFIIRMLFTIILIKTTHVCALDTLSTYYGKQSTLDTIIPMMLFIIIFVSEIIYAALCVIYNYNGRIEQAHFAIKWTAGVLHTWIITNIFVTLTYTYIKLSNETQLFSITTILTLVLLLSRINKKYCITALLMYSIDAVYANNDHVIIEPDMDYISDESWFTYIVTAFIGITTITLYTIGRKLGINFPIIKTIITIAMKTLAVIGVLTTALSLGYAGYKHISFESKVELSYRNGTLISDLPEVYRKPFDILQPYNVPLVVGFMALIAGSPPLLGHFSCFLTAIFLIFSSGWTFKSLYIICIAVVIVKALRKQGNYIDLFQDCLWIPIIILVLLVPQAEATPFLPIAGVALTYLTTKFLTIQNVNYLFGNLLYHLGGHTWNTAALLGAFHGKLPTIFHAQPNQLHQLPATSWITTRVAYLILYGVSMLTSKAGTYPKLINLSSFTYFFWNYLTTAFDYLGIYKSYYVDTNCVIQVNYRFLRWDWNLHNRVFTYSLENASTLARRCKVQYLLDTVSQIYINADFWYLCLDNSLYAYFAYYFFGYYGLETLAVVLFYAILIYSICDFSPAGMITIFATIDHFFNIVDYKISILIWYLLVFNRFTKALVIITKHYLYQRPKTTYKYQLTDHLQPEQKERSVCDMILQNYFGTTPYDDIGYTPLTKIKAGFKKRQFQLKRLCSYVTSQYIDEVNCYLNDPEKYQSYIKNIRLQGYKQEKPLIIAPMFTKNSSLMGYCTHTIINGQPYIIANKHVLERNTPTINNKHYDKWFELGDLVITKFNTDDQLLSTALPKNGPAIQHTPTGTIKCEIFNNNQIDTPILPGYCGCPIIQDNHIVGIQGYTDQLNNFFFIPHKFLGFISRRFRLHRVPFRPSDLIVYVVRDQIGSSYIYWKLSTKQSHTCTKRPFEDCDDDLHKSFAKSRHSVYEYGSTTSNSYCANCQAKTDGILCEKCTNVTTPIHLANGIHICAINQEEAIHKTRKILNEMKTVEESINSNVKDIAELRDLLTNTRHMRKDNIKNAAFITADLDSKIRTYEARIADITLEKANSRLKLAELIQDLGVLKRELSTHIETVQNSTKIYDLLSSVSCIGCGKTHKCDHDDNHPHTQECLKRASYINTQYHQCPRFTDKRWTNTIINNGHIFTNNDKRCACLSKGVCYQLDKRGEYVVRIDTPSVNGMEERSIYITRAILDTLDNREQNVTY